MSQSDFDIRRLHQNELSYIEDMERDNPGYTNEYYPRHKKWLKKALSDISSGHGRLAYGAFRIRRDHDGGFHDEFIGSAILTQPAFSNTGVIELKNLIVSQQRLIKKCSMSELDAEKEAETAKELLLNRIQRFAISRGFEFVLVECPANRDESSELEFYIKHGYSVIETRKNKYLPGDSVYILQKSMPVVYCGDPFDLQAVASWLIYNFYGHKGNEIDLNTYCHEDIQIISMTFPIQPNFYLKANSSHSIENENENENDFWAKWIICLEDWRYNLNDKIEKICSSIGLERIDQAVFLTTKREDKVRITPTTGGPNVRCLDRKWLEKNTGNESTIAKIQLDLSEIAGVLLELHPSCAPRLYQTYKDGNPELKFFVPNGVGKSRWDSGMGFPDHCALICSPSGGPSNSNPGIWARASIAGVEYLSYEDAREKALNNEAVMSGADFDYYLNTFHALHFNDEITCLILRDFEVFDQTVSLEKVLSSLVKKSMLFSEDNSAPLEVTTCYIDNESLSNLSELETNGHFKTWTPNQKQVFLSYRTNDGAYVSQLSDYLKNKFSDLLVFYDREEIREGDSLGLIKSEIEKSDAIVFIIGSLWRGDNDSNVGMKEDWVRKEVEWAISRFNDGKVFVLPVYLMKHDKEWIGNDPECVNQLANINPYVTTGRLQQDMASIAEILNNKCFNIQSS